MVYRSPNSPSELFRGLEAFVGRMEAEGNGHYTSGGSIGDIVEGRPLSQLTKLCKSMPTGLDYISTRHLRECPDLQVTYPNI